MKTSGINLFWRNAMFKLSGLKFGGDMDGGPVIINGKTYQGSNISIDHDGNINVDGKMDKLEKYGPVTVVSTGDCKSVQTVSGDISVVGDVSSSNVSTVSGDIKIYGSTKGGKISTVSGDITAKEKQDGTLVEDIISASDSIDNGRKLDDVLAHLTSEVGELAQEIIIAAGRSHKQPGKDGVVGEAIDVINCAIDIIRLVEPNITEQQMRVICDPKLDKWKKYAYSWYKIKEAETQIDSPCCGENRRQ